MGILLLQQGLTRQAVTPETEEETYQPTQMAHKDNSELPKVALEERKSRLNAVRKHLLAGDVAPYTEDHAVIKAIVRELEEVASEILKR